MKEIIIKSTELKPLIFWALVGFTKSNGGSFEDKMPRLFGKFMKILDMKTNETPGFGGKSKAELTGKTEKAVRDQLKKMFPRRSY